MLLVVLIFIFEIFKMLNFAYYQMTLVNVGQKGKVSTQKFIVTYFATLSSTEAEEQCEEGIASKY